MDAIDSQVRQVAAALTGGEWVTAGFTLVACIAIGWVLSFVTSEVITSRRSHEDRK
jgi:hypothetical protein